MLKQIDDMFCSETFFNWTMNSFRKETTHFLSEILRVVMSNDESYLLQEDTLKNNIEILMKPTIQSFRSVGNHPDLILQLSDAQRRRLPQPY